MAVVSLYLAAAAAAALVLALAAPALRALRALRKVAALEAALPGPTSLPLLGNLLKLAGTTEADVFHRLMDLWGKRHALSRLRILHMPIVVVSNHDDLAALVKRKDLNHKSAFFYDFMVEFARGGLIQASGLLWKAHRLAIQPAFHAEVLDPYLDVFAEEAEHYTARMVSQAVGAPGAETELRVGLRLNLARAFMRTTMVADVQPQDEDALAFMLHFIDLFLRGLNERSFKPWLWPGAVYALTAVGRQTKAARARFLDYCGDVIRRRRAALVATAAAGGGDRADDFLTRKKTLLDVMLSAENDDKYEMSEVDIMDEIMTFLGASVETSSSSLSMALKVLSMRPDVQERLHAEVAEVLGAGTKARSVTLQDLPKMPYLEQVLKETMRLLPAIPLTARQVLEDTEFQGALLPAGTTLAINIYGIHRNPAVFPDPETFDPDRFSEEGSRGRPALAFVPFSAGNRNCIGNRYAMMITKAMLATVVRDLRVDPADDGIVEPSQLRLTFDLSLRVVGGSRVKFTPRAATPAHAPARAQG